MVKVESLRDLDVSLARSASCVELRCAPNADLELDFVRDWNLEDLRLGDPGGTGLQSEGGGRSPTNESGLSCSELPIGGVGILESCFSLTVIALGSCGSLCTVLKLAFRCGEGRLG